jgi:hypothetical protein
MAPNSGHSRTDGSHTTSADNRCGRGVCVDTRMLSAVRDDRHGWLWLNRQTFAALFVGWGRTGGTATAKRGC